MSRRYCFLDEPTTGIDQSGREVLALLDTLKVQFGLTL